MHKYRLIDESENTDIKITAQFIFHTYVGVCGVKEHIYMDAFEQS